jgi:hypothetical protein
MSYTVSKSFVGKNLTKLFWDKTNTGDNSHNVVHKDAFAERITDKVLLMALLTTDFLLSLQQNC